MFKMVSAWSLASGLVLASVLPVRGAPPDAPAIVDVEITGDWSRADEGVLWADDFETAPDLARVYDDVNADGGRFAIGADGALGGSRRAVRQLYVPGQVRAGWMWRFFGDHPLAPRGPRISEVYVRWYHKFQAGFAGVPPKMARVGGFAGSDWTLSFMVHHWLDPRDGAIVADLASNIAPRGTSPLESGYNRHPRWLPVVRSAFTPAGPGNSGRWICHELHVRLNSPGAADGLVLVWADGKRVAAGDRLDLVGGYVERGINAVQWDCYWNAGSPVAQARYLDNVVVATHAIGPAFSPPAPWVEKSAFSDPDSADAQSGWQLEVASDPAGRDIVWVSAFIAGGDSRARVDADRGAFGGSARGRTELRAGARYWLRVRQSDRAGEWSAWSPWQAPVAVAPVAVAPVAAPPIRP